MSFLKTIRSVMSEVYAPKSPDENRFVKKHVIVKTRDAAGNKDDVFQATNVKSVERQPDHGYNPGEDEKVYEARSYQAPGSVFAKDTSAKHDVFKSRRAQPTNITSKEPASSSTQNQPGAITSPIESPKPITPKPLPQMSTVDPSKTVDQRMSELKTNLDALKRGEVTLGRGPTGKLQFKTVNKASGKPVSATPGKVVNKELPVVNKGSAVPVKAVASSTKDTPSVVPLPLPPRSQRVSPVGIKPAQPTPLSGRVIDVKPEELKRMNPEPALSGPKPNATSLVATPTQSTGSRLGGVGSVAKSVAGKALNLVAPAVAVTSASQMGNEIASGQSPTRTVAGTTATVGTLGLSNLVQKQLGRAAEAGNPAAKGAIKAQNAIASAGDIAANKATSAIGDKLDPTFRQYDKARMATSDVIEKGANIAKSASDYLSKTSGSALRSTTGVVDNISKRVKAFGKSIFQ